MKPGSYYYVKGQVKDVLGGTRLLTEDEISPGQPRLLTFLSELDGVLYFNEDFTPWPTWSAIAEDIQIKPHGELKLEWRQP